MKTPEEMAEEYAKQEGKPWGCERHYLAGYKAAKDEYKAQIKELETQLENWQHNAVHGDDGL